MKNLETLINELCPDGVEFVKLGDCCQILDSKRRPVSKAKRVAGDYPYYGANGIQDYVDSYLFDGIFLLLGEDGSVINKDKSPVLNWAVGKIWVNNHAHILAEKKEVASLRYLFFCLQGIDVSAIVRGTPPKLNQENLRNIEIPLPPIEVQNEIVRILDKFTSLEAELEAELDCRKRQYEYYRDKLLSFENVGGQNVEWKKMSEICLSICSGGTPLTSKPEYYDGDIPWLRTQEVDYCEINSTLRNITQLGLDNSSAKMIPSNCVIVAMYGATAAKVAINKIPLCTNQACCNLQIDESKAKVRYVYQWLCKQYDVLKALGEGSQHNINAKKVKDFAIPIPPLAEQERIVNILDRFESLTTSLTAGLPAEIAARRQQYEHYRDKLLTFKRKSA